MSSENRIKHQRDLSAWSEKIRRDTTPLPGSIPYENCRRVAVAGKYDHWTVERFLTARFPHVDAYRWKEVCDSSRLRLRGRILSFKERLRAGDIVSHVIPNTTEPEVNNDIRIIYEDSHLVVIDKPAPLPVHPSGRFNKNTLIAFLNTSRPDLKVRVVHRLDRDTTGVIIFAKTKEATSDLGRQFFHNSVSKTYLARVTNIPETKRFSCSREISSAVSNSGRRKIVAGGLCATTDFECLQVYDDNTALIKAVPITGRTNQIRLHLESLGHPIVGDEVFNGVCGFRRPLDTVPIPLLLHAWSVRFVHPHTAEHSEFKAESPAWAAAEAGSLEFA